MLLSQMSTRDVLAKYALTDPHADCLAFSRAAAHLGRRLHMKEVKASFMGQELATYTRATYAFTALDEWGAQIAISRDNAADCLADVARENASRFGARQRTHRAASPAPHDAFENYA